MALTTTDRPSSAPIARPAPKSRYQPQSKKQLPPSKHKPPMQRWLIVSSALLLLCVVALFAKGHGYRKATQRFLANVFSGQIFNARPLVEVTSVADGQTHVPRDMEFRAVLRLPNGSLDEYSVNIASVTLTCEDDHAQVNGLVNLVNGGDTITFQPASVLAANSRYTLSITEDIKDISGKALRPTSVTFTTAGQRSSKIAFEKLPLANTFGVPFTAVVVGPDHKLYASADDGRIFRFTISGDGTLADRQVLNGLRDAEGGPRLISGFCFDPAATADHLVLWVSNNFYTFHNAPDFSSKITVLSGPNLENACDKVVHLPRSVNDHLTNQPSFGPDGALYIPQGSMTATGAPDITWGNRPEHLLSGAILRLDTHKLSDAPLDVMTADGGGTYNPTAPGAPLTIYATGVRNAYDLLWHSNGRLYVPVNGASCGGNTPAGRGAPALSNIPFNETDWLFRITPGKYYGHPNPLQNHFVLNGGNPSKGHHFGDTPQYPIGTPPDPDWQPAIYDFGRHVSANGIVEYRGKAFGGELDRAILVCRYNVGADVTALRVDRNGYIASTCANIPGCGGMQNPLDITEDLQTGNLYVTDYGALKIYLLRPSQTPQP